MCLDAAAVQLGEPLHQRQTNSEPTLCPVGGRLSLDEEVEDAGKQLGGNAQAVVLDAQSGVPAFPCHANFYRSTWRRVLQRVRHEVGHDLLDPGRVGIDPCRRTVERDRVTLDSSALPQAADRTFGDLAKVDRLHI